MPQGRALASYSLTAPPSAGFRQICYILRKNIANIRIRPQTILREANPAAAQFRAELLVLHTVKSICIEQLQKRLS